MLRMRKLYKTEKHFDNSTFKTQNVHNLVEIPKKNFDQILLQTFLSSCRKSFD